MSGHPRDKARERVARMRDLFRRGEPGAMSVSDVYLLLDDCDASLAREEAERAGRERAEAALEWARDFCARPPGVCFPAREPGKESS